MKTKHAGTMFHLKCKLHCMYGLYREMAFALEPTRGMWMTK